jgi:hypothetical protein
VSKIIKTESAGKDRNLLVKSVVVALRELLKQTDTGKETMDIVAYISSALQSIAETVDESVAAWEKRGYWVKAEHFRMDWEWTGFYAKGFRESLFDEDWAGVASLAARTGQKLSSVKVAEHNRIGTPWKGAYAKIKSN